jgi:outer membrane protein
MSRYLVRATLVTLSLLAATAARAQTAARAAPTVVVGPDRPFSLEEAVALAMHKSFNLQIQGITLENAKDNIVIQEAAIADPTLTASITKNVSQSASTTSRLDGTAAEGPRNDNAQWRVGANLPRITATNTTVSVSANASRGATNSTNSLFNPSYASGVSLNVSQPLMQDFGRNAALAALENARLAYNIANITYKSNILTLVTSVENAYFNVVAARESLRIRQLSLESSQRLLSENQARRQSGTMTDLDVLSAEVGVANNRRALVQQEQSVRDAEESLLNLINAPNLEVRPGAMTFEVYTEGQPNFAQSYKLARDFYPDRLSAEQTIKQLEINLETARRNTMPNLDLTASLGYNARTTNQGYSEALSNLPSDHGNQWSIGLNYSLPWGQRADKARYRQAANNLTSQKIRLEQLEQQLMVDVRAAVRGIETNLVAVEISAKSTELAVRQYDLQKARFDNGLSTSRIVLQAQDDLESARVNELNAKLALRRAVSTLRRLEGTSLTRFKVDVP